MILQKTGLLNFTQGSYTFYAGSPAGSHLSKLVATPASVVKSFLLFNSTFLVCQLFLKSLVPVPSSTSCSAFLSIQVSLKCITTGTHAMSAINNQIQNVHQVVLDSRPMSSDGHYMAILILLGT